MIKIDKKVFLLGGIIIVIIALFIYKISSKPIVPKVAKKDKVEVEVQQKREAKETKNALPTSDREEIESVVLAFTQTLYFASYYKSNYELVTTNVDDKFYPSEIRLKDEIEKGKYIVNYITKGKSITKVTSRRTNFHSDTSIYEIKVSYFDKSTIDYFQITLEKTKVVEIKEIIKD